jgi:signal transduction histidine kinase
MRMYPDTLFGRLVAGLLAVLGITLLVIVLLIVRERRELSLWGGDAPEVVLAIADVTAELASLQAWARARYIDELQAEPVEVEEKIESRPRPPPNDTGAAARTYRRLVQRQLGADYEVTVEPARGGRDDVIRVLSRPRAPSAGGSGGGTLPAGPDRGAPEGEPSMPPGPHGPGTAPGRFLDVTVGLPGGEHVVYRVDAPRAAPPMPRTIFVELAIIAVLLSIVLYFMTRTITRPLSELAAAAEAVGTGKHRALREKGTRELREATHAFNVMQERLHRYLDSRTQVLAAMSHDLRTPLTRLRLRAERLDDADLRDRFVADLDEMNGMVVAALNLFRGFNEGEAREKVDLAGLLADLRGEFAEIGYEVDVEQFRNLQLEADLQALKRCLTNLLTNAVKFGKRAVVRVEAGSDVVIRIRDEGPGIPEESLEKVFEPFYRLESSRNPATGGTGLGLGIARDIAQAHGGFLSLRNHPTGGLEAILTLPRKRTR